MPMTPDEIIRLLRKNGFTYVRSHGSHRIFYNPATGNITVVPYHKGDLAKATERKILKQAGLK